ncbi:hypothetical protein [Pseudonocardia sp. T1-2H]|uniref:hypothetical protein n=1 Tax=Pseudonocardia sp. T1-2H TaxID=3128899 RepID=UPI0031018367
MNPHEEIRFSAQHGGHDTAPAVLLVLLVLTITATVAVVVTGTGLVIAAATAAGGVLTVAGARVLARRVWERREDAADEIEGARWWATQQNHRTSSTELSPGEPGPRELTR